MKKLLCLSIIVILLMGLNILPARAISLEIVPQITSYDGLFPATVNVRLVVLGLGSHTAPSLGGFDLDFGYQPHVLTLTNITFGSLLGNPDISQFNALNNGNLGGPLLAVPKFPPGLGAATRADLPHFDPQLGPPNAVRLTLSETSLLEASSTTCTFCVGPFLDDLQPSAFGFAALNFDVRQTNSASQLALFIHGIGDAFGDPLVVSNAVIGPTSIPVVFGPPVSTAPIPEPGTILLMGSGLVVIVWRKFLNQVLSRGW